MRTQNTLFQSEQVNDALKQSFVKLNPRILIKNPVMFTVEIGTVVMLIVSIYSFANKGQGSFGYNVTVFAVLLLTGLAPLAAQAQSPPNTQSGVVTAPGKVAGAATTEVTAKITAVDPVQHTVTLQSASGKTRTIQVGDQVRNFDQIKVGDTVHAEYTEALALQLKKGATTTGAPTEEDAITAPPAPGAKPGGAVARKVTAMTEVVAVDPAKQMVTLRGPEGNEVDVNVQDPNQLKNIKKGDHVQVTYTQALAIAVAAEPAKK